MSEPSEVHATILSNIAGPMLRELHGLLRHVYVGGMAVQRSGDRADTYLPRPDIVIGCGPLSRRNFITDPLAVVEVLSPSTMDVDRGEKLQFYQSLPTLRHIALVYQDQMRVELYGRTEDGWEATPLTTPAVRLEFEALEFAMTLDQVYFGVDMAA